ncbi:phytanoyl-CoA dioxygenase family protein [Burkholderia mayonis]|uniref:phytanoyl-CoA dioxygenase family protein n=1 Tax=Burkholderia mayonis TaxID=1385591 RepID=UPI001CF7A570
MDVKRFFCSPELIGALDAHLGIAMPVQTGSIVTHCTANNSIGNNYGLPCHQDWPSMGTSSRDVIAWTAIPDVRKGAPGLRIVPGSHLRGLGRARRPTAATRSTVGTSTARWTWRSRRARSCSCRRIWCIRSRPATR